MPRLKKTSQLADDPKVLRAIAHPVRNRILDELSAAGSMRAADVASTLGIPANQASFHLRQLAKYGLVVEAPEEARDGRDRVWKPAHEHGLNLDLQSLLEQPGGKAAVAVWRRQATAWAHNAVEHAFAARRGRGGHVMISDHPLRLTRTEAKKLSGELTALMERWEMPKDDGAERRTYHLMQILQPYPEAATDAE